MTTHNDFILAKSQLLEKIREEILSRLDIDVNVKRIKLKTQVPFVPSNGMYFGQQNTFITKINSTGYIQRKNTFGEVINDSNFSYSIFDLDMNCCLQILKQIENKEFTMCEN